MHVLKKVRWYGVHTSTHLFDERGYDYGDVTVIYVLIVVVDKADCGISLESLLGRDVLYDVGTNLSLGDTPRT